jgi:hypothetical protein
LRWREAEIIDSVSALGHDRYDMTPTDHLCHGGVTRSGRIGQTESGDRLPPR